MIDGVHGTHNAVPDDRNKDVLIYVNGELTKREDAKISVFDSGYLVGDGVWEALRLHEGVLVFVEEHFDRLWTAAATVGMKLPWTEDELKAEIWKTLNANEMVDNIHCRFMVTRGIKKTPSQDPRLTITGPNLVIIAEHKKASRESKENGITLFTSTIRRGQPDYLDARLNCHSKLHEVMALVQAIEAGADEALMLDVNGMVATCNATNFFIVKNRELLTSTGQYCMNGITRGKVIEVAAENGIPCRQTDFSLFDVYGADEAFVTGTFGGMTPVTHVDGRQIGEGNFGPMTHKVSDLYEAKIHQYVADFKANS
ncbi:MAG: aminotransferase class IV [Chloroflexota bacterium]